MSVNQVNLGYTAAANAKISSVTLAPKYKSGIPSIRKDAEYNTAVQSVSGLIQPTVYPIKFIEKYINKDVVQNALDTNPQITTILKDNGIQNAEISKKNINQALKNHLFMTYVYAMGIAKFTGLSKEETSQLAEAALVHDIGKAVIPKEIIQKPDKLTPEERRIIDLHSVLGAEILKTTDISPEVISIVAMHHSQNDEKDKSINNLAQILSVADMYSALKEKRPYKDTMSDEKAFEIMQGMPHPSTPHINALFRYKQLIN